MLPGLRRSLAPHDGQPQGRPHDPGRQREARDLRLQGDGSLCLIAPGDDAVAVNINECLQDLTSRISQLEKSGKAGRSIRIVFDD
jgi:hypothetical protein